MFMTTPALNVALSKSVYRALSATGLRAVGGVARVADVNEQPALLRSTVHNESMKLGLSFVGGIFVDFVLMRIFPSLGRNRIAKFVPQVLAMTASEVFGRKFTSYNKALNAALGTKAPALETDRFEGGQKSRTDASTSPAVTFAATPPSLYAGQARHAMRGFY